MTVYAIESKGVIPALRVELQCRDACATQLAGELLSAAERKVGLAEVLVKHLVSFIDLREPSGSRSKSSNWPRLPWWHEFVGSASKAALVQDDRSEAVAWFGRMSVQVRGFLWVALALFNLEPADITKLLPSGECRSPGYQDHPRFTQASARAGGRVAGPLIRILVELAPRSRAFREATRTAWGGSESALARLCLVHLDGPQGRVASTAALVYVGS